MKRKLSSTTIADAETQQRQLNCEANNVGWRMSQHQLTVDCKGLPINAFSPTEGTCSTSLVRQNAYDSGTCPAKEMPPPLVSSSSVSSNDLPGCSLNVETEAVSLVNSNFTKEGHNCDPSLSGDLNNPSLTGFLTSSPSNDSYPTGIDCVSFQYSSISLGSRFENKCCA